MKKRFLALFIVLVMLFSQTTIFASDLDTSSTSENPEDKLTDELKEVMSNTPDDEYISIYIWLKGYADDAIYDLLSYELGENISKETEDNYIQTQIKAKTEKARKNEKAIIEQKTSLIENELTTSQRAQELIQKANISAVMSENEIKKCIEAEMSYEEIIEISERTEFLSKWREKREILNGSINSVFEAKIDEQNSKNVYVDSLLSYVTLECKKSYISTISSFDEVDEIGHHVEHEAFLDVEETASANNNNGYHMTEKEGISYNAAGIKIGVIEVPQLFYDESGNELSRKGTFFEIVGEHLPSESNERLISNYEFLNIPMINRVASEHAITVLSIICGSELTRSDGVKYKGIAPNATVYYVNYNVEYGFQKSIAWCLENNVSVINMSFGYKYGNYSEIDRYVDSIIEQYRVSIVKSAGNYHEQKNPNSLITSPGLAYNAITVGNMDWQLTATGQYQLNETSCFQQESYLSNKPDISAIGTDIYLLDHSGNPENRGSGTSFAAPMVTGTIALMMKENSALIGKPDVVKSILVTTADADNISNDIRETDQNDYLNVVGSDITFLTTTPTLKNGSGAGLLNVQGAVATSKTNQLERYAFSQRATVTAGQYYFSENQKIKISLVFEKIDYKIVSSMDDITTDFDITIAEPNGNIIASSWSPMTNVEILQCEFKQSGYYKIIITGCKFPTEDEFNSTQTIYSEDGNWEEIYPSSYCYASLLFVCDCDKSELSVNCNGGESHAISCSNCDFVCQEKHSTATYVAGSDFSLVEYKVNYIFKNSIEGYGFQNRICYEIVEPVVTLAYFSHAAIVSFESASTQYEEDGSTIETRTYWIVIRDENGSVVESFYSTAIISYNLATGTYYITGG